MISYDNPGYAGVLSPAKWLAAFPSSSMILNRPVFFSWAQAGNMGMGYHGGTTKTETYGLPSLHAMVP